MMPFLIISFLLFACDNPRDEQVEGLIRLREARKGLSVLSLTIEAAKPTNEGSLIYYNFTIKQPVLQKLRDSILVTRTINGDYREVP